MAHDLSMRWRLRYWAGSIAQHVAWWLCDPHDRWMIQHRGRDGKVYVEIRDCHYRIALATARELKGKIVGSGVSDGIPDTDERSSHT